MSETTRPRQRGIHHLGLSVRNLDRSIQFYCDLLGAELIRPPYDGDRDSFKGRMAIVMIGSTGLDLYEHEANGAKEFDPARTGLDHVALTASTRDELDAWASWLDRSQVARSPVRDTDGFGWMFDFKDPDGIQIEYYFLDYEKLASSGFLTSNRDQ